MPGKTDIEKLILIDMDRFGVYSPCKSVELMAARLGIPAESIIKVDANENPYGCSPRVYRALASYRYFNTYPDASQTGLRHLLASYTGIGAEQIVAGNGSDELIDLLLRMFVAPGNEVIIAVPTFDMYRFSTEVCRGRPVAVPRRSDFTVDVAAIKAAVTGQTRLIFIASPNNPTGTTISQKDILALAEIGLPLVIDEAYYEFSQETVAPQVAGHSNLFVLRTFSKWAGLAGLRVGYGIFPPEIAEYLLKIKPPYNVNMAAEVAVRESLNDRAYLLDTVRRMIEERDRLFGELKKVSYLKPVPSRANFILCLVTKGKAKQIQQELENKGILVRYYDTPLLKNYIRISVGKPEHTDIIMAALRELEEKING